MWEIGKIVKGMQALVSRYGDAAAGGLFEPLMVGGSHALSAWALPSLIAKYKRKYPHVQISLRTKSSPVIERLVLESEIDLGLVTNPPSSPLLRLEPYRRETMVIAVSRHHALAHKRELTLKELAQGPLIIRERKQSSSRKFLDQLEQLAYEPNILMICDSASAVKNAVLGGLGIGIIYRDHVKREMKNGDLKALKVKGLKKVRFQSFIIYRKDKQFSHPAQDFYDMLCESRRDDQGIRPADQGLPTSSQSASLASDSI